MDAGMEDFLADPFGGKGTLLHNYPDKRVWLGPHPEHPDDPNMIAQCEVYRLDPVFEANKKLLNDSQNKRFGDGQIVASIPMPFYFDKIVPMKKAGDDKGIKRLLNDSDFRNLRTFRGKI
jgi:hypothetical protein